MKPDVELIEDALELAQVRKQARMVQIKALLAAIPLTVAAFMLPQRLRRKAVMVSTSLTTLYAAA